MSKYKEMVEHAVKNGADESRMWKAVDVVDSMLCKIKHEHPEEYSKYMRKLTEAMNGCHYNEELAREDVNKMFHTDSKNVKHYGQHWGAADIETATEGLPFPSGTTLWDKYVAYNAAWHDFTNEFDDGQVLSIAYLLFFKDEDFMSGGKIWKYMSIE